MIDLLNLKIRFYLLINELSPYTFTFIIADKFEYILGTLFCFAFTNNNSSQIPFFSALLYIVNIEFILLMTLHELFKTYVFYVTI